MRVSRNDELAARVSHRTMNCITSVALKVVTLRRGWLHKYKQLIATPKLLDNGRYAPDPIAIFTTVSSPSR